MAFLKSTTSKVAGVLALVAIISITAVATSFLSGSSKHASALPYDVAAVVKIDLKSSVSDMGFNFLDLLDIISKYIEKSGDKKIDLSKSGIDFFSSIYFFSGKSYSNKMPELGVVIPLSDSQLFKGFIKDITSSNPVVFEEKDGIRFYTQNQNFIGFDDNKCLIISSDKWSNGDNTDKIRLRGLKLMKQEVSKSGRESELFSKLTSSPISASISGELIGKYISNNNSFNISQMPFPYDFSDTYYTANIDFMYKGFSANASFESDNDEFNKIMKESLKTFDEIEGDQLDKFSLNDDIFLAFNINGEEYYKYILSFIPKDFRPFFDQAISNLKDMSVDVEKMFSAIDGDIYYSYPNIDLKSADIQPMTLLAKEEDNSSFGIYSSALEGSLKGSDIFSIKKDGNNYVISAGEIDWDASKNNNFSPYVYKDSSPIAYFGEHDNYIYVSSVEYKGDKVRGESMKEMKSKICGNNFFFTVNFDKLAPVIAKEYKTIDFAELVKTLDRLNLYTKGFEATGELLLNKSWKDIYNEYMK